MFTLRPDCQLVLASASPRRQELLSSLAIPFLIHPSTIPEEPPLLNESPGEYAGRMAAAKAKAVHEAPVAIVLAADTVVSLDALILGKPKNAADALRMLQLLNGKTHKVHTAIHLIFPSEQHISQICETAVTFHKWSESILQAYVQTGEPLDKAGAYAIQGVGSFLVSSVDGSVSNVVGLPLSELLAILLARNLLFPAA